MNEKPEAVRLAEELYRLFGCRAVDAPTELRRLHAENERLKAERDEAVKAEREACAVVCDGWAAYGIPAAAAAADTIRARGQENKT